MTTPRATPRTTPNSRPIFYYDGECGFCGMVVKLLSRIDLSGKIIWTPVQLLSLPPAGLTWDDLDKAAYLQDKHGNLHRGFYAFRQVALLVPLLWPVAVAFHVPGVPTCGVRVYAWVARRRRKVCTLPLQ